MEASSPFSSLSVLVLSLTKMPLLFGTVSLYNASHPFNLSFKLVLRSGIAGSIMWLISIIYLRSPSGLPTRSELSVTRTGERTIMQHPSQLLTQLSSSGSTPIDSLLYALEGQAYRRRSTYSTNQSRLCSLLFNGAHVI
ncbi:uncharacterized protein F5147DRAFT_336835 [Suillus discolor]|uniref:Uncharacterized protein n=1 Tax=Suillus discolor TaxID=1912936 RepID=A0A9P7EZ83_9AGAM|nr:uncharacterized protein F5147DRAFT_336835 [Suillus discolor]KAG2099611.1 hypothetical protein F5147DRAFT_336835 [Suillus discolor]